MSDREQQTQPQHKNQSNKLSTEDLQSNNSNLFSYKNRSSHGSRSQSDEHNEEFRKDSQNSYEQNQETTQENEDKGNEKKRKISHKLSDMLGLGQGEGELIKNLSAVSEKKEMGDSQGQIQLVQQDNHHHNQQQKQKQIVKKGQEQKQETRIQAGSIKTQEAQQTVQHNKQKQKNEEKQAIKQQANRTTEPEKIQAQPEVNDEKIQVEQIKVYKIEKDIPIEVQWKKQQKPDYIRQDTNEPQTQVKQKSLGKNNQQPISEKPRANQSSKQLDKQYQDQLQSDMAALKSSLTSKKLKSKNSDKQKQKQHEKNKLNKTVMPVPTSNTKQFQQQQQTAQIKAMELKMITKMAQEKKKQNYQRLKQWDKRRAESLAIHRNMVQILQSQIDKRIKSSIENLQIYTTFFREKAKQDQRYIAHPVINTKFALQHNSISKNVYINCTVILNTLSDENNAKCRRINDFIQVIRNDILRDSIQVHLQQSQKELLRVREKISNLKHALRKYNTQTEEKTNQLALFFNENALNMNTQSDKDFYSTQIEFLQKASQQTLVQKKLGQYCIQYLQVAINQEIKRSKVIREAMITFSKALQQCYGIEPDPAEIEQLSKAEQHKLIEQFYSLQEIFDERCLSVFKSNQNFSNSKELTVEQFSQYLKKFDFEGYDSRVILLKEYHVRYHPTNKNQTNKEQNCYLVITVDKFIHLFLSKQKTDPYAKPDVSIKATLKNLQLKPVKTQMLDIVIKDERRGSMISYFWEPRNDRIYRVQFQKRDAREQFADYMRKMRG